MADSSLVDDALIAKLLSDQQLRALLPDGVWWDESANDKKRFCIVSLIEHNDNAVFGGNAFEDSLYLVKAVVLNGSGDIKAAAQRIHDILEDGSLTIQGYGLMTMHRESRVRSTEVDEVTPSVRWLHRGGRYRVQVALT